MSSLCSRENIQSIPNPDIVLVIGPNPQMVWRTFQLQRHTAFVLFSSCTVLPLTWHGYRGHSLRLAQCIHLHMLKGFVGSRLEVPGIRGEHETAHTLNDTQHFCMHTSVLTLHTASQKHTWTLITLHGP